MCGEQTGTVLYTLGGKPLTSFHILFTAVKIWSRNLPKVHLFVSLREIITFIRNRIPGAPGNSMHVCHSEFINKPTRSKS